MDFETELRDICKEILRIEDREWKPVKVFRNDEQVARDEARHELAIEIADKARSILDRMTANSPLDATSAPSGAPARQLRR